MHPMLREVVFKGFDHTPSVRLWVSDLGRTTEEDVKLGASGIHAAGPPWRACDAGWEDMHQEAVNIVCANINKQYQYDPKRPHLQVAYGAPHGTGLHIHYQVHPNTIRISPDEYR